MLSKMRDTLSIARRRLRYLTTAWLPIVNAEKQSKASWAKPIRIFADLPDVYRDFFESFSAGEQTFPYAVLTPSYEGYMHRATEKLICTLGRELYILESKAEGYTELCYPLEEISYVEMRTVLLDSRIKISGLTQQGNLTTTTFRFNSVTDYLFTPILKKVRLAAAGIQNAVQDSELEKFDHWARINYKFMSYAKRSLLEGEKVIHAILQPEIRISVVRVLGRVFYRMVSPAHATILTDRELIVIREEQHRSGERYGGTWDYIPADKIDALVLDRREDGLLVLTIQLPGEESLSYLFQAAMEEEINQLLNEIHT